MDHGFNYKHGWINYKHGWIMDAFTIMDHGSITSMAGLITSMADSTSVAGTIRLTHIVTLQEGVHDLSEHLQEQQARKSWHLTHKSWHLTHKSRHLTHESWEAHTSSTTPWPVMDVEPHMHYQHKHTDLHTGTRTHL